MVHDCSFYFLSNTAVQAWKNNDTEVLNKMFVCLTKEHKENWFRRVIYANGIIAQWRLTEIAENTFLTAWEKFNEDGKTGKINFISAEYTGFLFKIFQRKYIKVLQNEIKEEHRKRNYLNNLREVNGSSAESTDNNSDAARTMKILAMLNPDCQELMKWRYLERLSYDDIAKRKSIREESCKQNLFRCKKRFLELWKKDKKQL